MTIPKTAKEWLWWSRWMRLGMRQSNDVRIAFNRGLELGARIAELHEGKQIAADIRNRKIKRRRRKREPEEPEEEIVYAPPSERLAEALRKYMERDGT